MQLTRVRNVSPVLDLLKTTKKKNEGEKGKECDDDDAEHIVILSGRVREERGESVHKDNNLICTRKDQVR